MEFILIWTGILKECRMADFPITSFGKFSGTMAQITNQDRGAPDTFNPRYQKLLDNDNYLKED